MWWRPNFKSSNALFWFKQKRYLEQLKLKGWSPEFTVKALELTPALFCAYVLSLLRTVEKIIKEVIAGFNLLSLRFLLRVKFLSPLLCRRRRWLADKMVTGLLAALRGRSCQSQLPAHVGMATPSPGLPVFLQTCGICFPTGIAGLQPVKMLETVLINGRVELKRME